MNRDHAEGTWEILKGKSRKIWAELTDDDFSKAQGNAEQLYGTIQRKFGDTKEAILKKIEAFKG